jgi:capsular polysaccharide biosynthesis protein
VNIGIAELIEIFIAAARRRKRLIIVPIIVFTALSVLAVLFWPRQYTARALLMLQEGQSANPFSADGGAARQGRLKAEEIDMLLKSDRVLSAALNDMNLGKKPLTQSAIEGEIRSLRKQINVGVVGNDFIEIEFKQAEREGIGERLSIIMTRFFEHLLTREDSMKTAREFALEQRWRGVASTISSLEDWMTRAKAAGASSLSDDGRMAELKKQYQDLEKKLVTSASSLLPSTNLAILDQVINDEIRLSSSRAQTPQLGGAADRIVTLKELAADVSAYQSVGLEIAELQTENARAMAQSLRQLQGDSTDDKTKKLRDELYGEWERTATRYSEAMEHYDKHVKRAKKGSGPSLTPFGLIAPESIRIIDEPHDPALPSTSALKIIIACLAAGLGLGAGLAALAEQLDDRIYSSRGLNTLAGVDAVFKLSRIDAELDTQAAETPSAEPAARKGRLAVVSGPERKLS